MKGLQKDSEKIIWDQVRSSPRTPSSVSAVQHRPLPKSMVFLILFVSATYVVYTLKLLNSSHSCNDEFLPSSTTRHNSILLPVNSSAILSSTPPPPPAAPLFDEIPVKKVEKTGLEHVVFGIAASSKLWSKRKNYIKTWWKKEEMRGIVWLDKKVPINTTEKDSLPELRISRGTSQFPYTNKQGDRSALRISRIVSETLKLGMENVRWFVMGDDDTVFITDNLLRVLNKYDHNQYYYIGSLSESHLQNIFFSYGMAYGGGGFAISYPLAKALAKMQDRCIHRYPGLYGSDDRMQACMAELGVPLTKEPGFHQGNSSYKNSPYRVDCCLTPTKESLLPPVTLQFQQGLSQKFQQPSGTGMDLSMFSEAELSKEGEMDVYPLAVKAEALLEKPDGSSGDNSGPDVGSTNSQITQAAFEKDTGEYRIKAVKKILWVNGMRYELQEIYGMGSVDSDFYGNDPGKECVICLSEPRDTTVLPCRHMCMCSGCAKVLRFQTNRCPICRQPVERLLEIKVSNGGEE